MGNFSKTPSDVLQKSLDKNYVGVHIEQGVPVLDRDLNLLHDMISNTLQSVISRFMGDGVAAGSNGFAIQAIPADNDFRILAGSVLVNGIDIFNAADFNYSSQAGAPALTPPSPIFLGIRHDTVYLDVSLTEVDGTQDAELLNSGDVGLQTSVRQKVVWAVRVKENATSPPPAPRGHTYFPLARLNRLGNPQIQADMIIDLRKQIFSLQQLGIVGAPVFGAPGNQFTPNSGKAGDQITIFGRNFALGALRVGFIAHDLTGPSDPFAPPIYATIIPGTTDTQVVVQVPPFLPGVLSGLNIPCTIRVENMFGVNDCGDVFSAHR